jgi:hypothetical protein
MIIVINKNDKFNLNLVLFFFQVRKVRTLSEIIVDAKEVAIAPPKKSNKKQKVFAACDLSYDYYDVFSCANITPVSQRKYNSSCCSRFFFFFSQIMHEMNIFQCFPLCYKYVKMYSRIGDIF